MIQYDAIRLVAILAIVVLHTAANGVNQLPVNSANWWLANLADSASRVGVPLFLMLTGALLLNRRGENTRHFYQKRWQRLAFPFFAWSLLYLLWAQLKAYIKQQPVDIPAQLIGLITGDSYFHLWFIYLLIGIYAILPFLRNYWQRLTVQQQHWLTITSILLQQLLLLLRYASQQWPLPEWLDVPNWLQQADQLPWPLWFIAYLPYLMLGAVLSTQRPSGAKIGPLLLLLLSVNVVITAALYAVQKLYLSPEPFYYAYHRLSLPVLLSTILLWLWLQQRFGQAADALPNRGKPALSGMAQALVRCSFGIYLIHPIWLDLSSKLLQQPYLSLPYWLQLPLQVFLIVLASLYSCIVWQRLRPTG